MYLITLLFCVHIALASDQACDPFSVIDLGYAKHMPTVVNITSLHNISYATYSNIRFAQPPIGNNRFRKPQLPPPTNATVQNGIVPTNSTDCLIYIPPYLTIGEGVNGTSWGSEDCLFLDVKVPEGIKGGNVPVLHWIYGGGYVFGSKNAWAGDTAGLFEDMAPDQKFITVASNYRLSALGWMSSETEPDMDKNIGVWDALAALEWTKEYISYFGGDSDDITAIGESTGGAIVQHLITAKGGNMSLPFNKAILTSPGYRPHVNRSAGITAIYNDFLNVTNCSSIACLRSLPSDAIAKANIDMYSIPNEGWLGPDIGYGPIIDGDLVTDVPDRLMIQGQFNKGVKRVLTVDMALDGYAGTVGTAENWEEQLKFYMKTPTEVALNQSRTIYGANVTEGSTFFNKDAIYACHAYFTAAAFRNSSVSSAYRYSMSIPPATHGEDQYYYFYTATVANASVTSPEVAKQLEAYFRNFILEGRTGGGDGCQNGTVHWPAYGNAERWMNVTSDGFKLVYGESNQRTRCEALMDLINDPANGW